MLRREFLASAAALSLAPAARAGEPDDLDALLARFFEADLQRSPERATELGLDTGPRAALKFRLGDASAQGLEAERAAAAEKLAALARLDRSSLKRPAQTVYDTVMYVERAKARVEAFDFTVLDGFSPSPYPLSPITGAYQRVPVFLDTKHRVETAQDAEAYLSRLSGFSALLAANTDRFKAAAAEGALPPDFLLETTLGQLRQLRTRPEDAGVVRSLARRTAEHGLSPDYARRAALIYAEKVGPALDAQIAAVAGAKANAGHDPGVWRFKNGPEFYAANLQFTTTTDMSPEEIHALGLDQAREYAGKLDALLKAQGLTRGGVGERIRSLYSRPDQVYPDTPAGKARLVADLQARLESVRSKLPRAFSDVPANLRVEVRAVPPAIDAGAPMAYSERPSLDGSRPGYVYFNLHDTADWARFSLPSTLYHESLPGHQLQGAVALQNPDIPLYVRDLYFSGYGEGWALYAEQLADELGEYDADPIGRIGLYQGLIFRAGRCVVDTGMHHYRWSRERAIQELSALDGDAPGATTREVDRYVAIPAQACSYKIGHTTWNRLRDRARAALGPRFDIRGFHAAGLRPGALPLAVLDQVLADWTRDQART